jgi:hypothetical protein
MLIETKDRYVSDDIDFNVLANERSHVSEMDHACRNHNSLSIV